MERLINDIFSDKKVVVITGAGISTLSGARDFRGANGIYTASPTITRLALTRTNFRVNPEEFYEFYINNMMFDNLEPNIIHKVLKDLEDSGYINGIITQNIDMLHQKAGSNRVVNLHGDGDKFYCEKCYAEYNSDDYRNNKGKCTCGCCNGFVRPDIVLYGEELDHRRRHDAIRLVNSAEVLLVLGSSLTVSDIQELLKLYTHADDPDKPLYIVNDQRTDFDSYAMMYGAKYNDLEEVFVRLEQEIKDRKPKVLLNHKKDN